MRITEKAISHLEKIKLLIPQWIADVLLDKKEEIIDILQRKQLGIGLDSHGKGLVHPSKVNNPDRVPLYEPSTEDYWQHQPPQARTYKKTNARYNFEWTGRFFDGMDLFVNKSNYSFEIKSTGNQEELEVIYNTDLTGLSIENMEYVDKFIIQPYVSQKIVENLFAF